MNQLFEAIESNNLSMGSLSIYQNGEEVYQRSAGYENAEKKIASTTNTRYRVGSITKSFMAVIIVQMIEEGKLQLDTKLSTYYPNFQNAEKITIESLLRHRSGLFNFTDDPSYQTYNESYQSQEQLIEKLISNENVFPPDERAEYSNTGYVLLSYIAEEVDGKIFGQILTDRITSPLGLNDTYHGGKIGTSANEAKSYRLQDDWIPVPETDMSIPMGAGAIVSTPGDINIFYHSLFSGIILKPTFLDQLTLMKDGYGFGIHEFDFGYNKALGHGGSIDGFNAIAGHFPQENTTFCYLSNGTSLDVGEIANGALKIYFGKEYEIPDFHAMKLPLLLERASDDPQIIERVKHLLDRGADINAQTQSGDTAVILAGWNTDNIDLVRYLVERGADVNIPNNNGDTPVIDAAYLGRNEILKYLLSQGAQVDIKNKGGRSALVMAKETGNTEAIKILSSHSKK